MRFSLACTPRVTIFFALFLLAVINTPADAQVGINVFGLSKHFNSVNESDDESSDESDPSSFNPGLGVHWTFDRGRRTSLELNAGLYRDSFHNLNQHLSLGGRLRLWGPLEIGLQAVLAKSLSMNDGNAFLYPLPFLSLRHPRIVLNSVYIPAVSSFNSIPTLALTATIFPFKAGFVWDDPQQQHSHRRSSLEFRLFDLTDLKGYRGFGIAWRRMFNPHHGMRFGADFDGVLAFDEPDSQSEFETRVLVQYLHRFSADRRSGCFVAGGGRIGFKEVPERVNMQYELVLNLGWEYSLNGDFSVFVETGLALRQRYEDITRGNYGEESLSFSQTAMHSDGITIGLTAGL